MSQTPKPLIGLTADRQLHQDYFWHQAEEHYLLAVVEAMDALPVIIPALAERLDQTALLQRLDGLLVTGGASNIEPHFYGRESEQPRSARDPQRDATNLKLIPQAVALGVPVLGICRGLQEMNVAFGGTLHQRVHRVDNELTVNSVHGQGIDQLAPLLRVEAVAPDGLIEAISIPTAKNFACAVQWHPEWYDINAPHCRALLEAFAMSCRHYAASKASAK
jgi:putative glutamine amidotransferase